MKENESLAVEAVLCANMALQLREVLNTGHGAANPVSKFRISSHPTPKIINSGSCSQPLPPICGVCPVFLSAVTHKTTGAHWLSYSQYFCTGTSCFSWIQILLHTYGMPQT